MSLYILSQRLGDGLLRLESLFKSRMRSSLVIPELRVSRVSKHKQRCMKPARMSMLHPVKLLPSSVK